MNRTCTCMSPAKRMYIDTYGYHFTKRAYDYATEYMEDIDGHVVPFTKEEVDNLLKEYGVHLKRKIMYDYVYIATMSKADYKQTIDDEHRRAMFIKETIDDVDASSETPFRRWIATMEGNNIPIDWEDIC